MLPLKNRESVGVLSVQDATVDSLRSRLSAMTSKCRVVAACSRSLLVMVPPGLSYVTSWSRMTSGNAARHTTGGMPAEK